jgi:CelD/BcsL family acetyltransferase involved in cellulose biosynthesis
MRNILAVAAAGLAVALFANAHASSESAWNTLDRTAHATCAQQIKVLASKARVSRSTGRVLGIGGDGDQYYALMFKGKEGGAQARWLCLYDKHTKKAQAREITD